MHGDLVGLSAGWNNWSERSVDKTPINVLSLCTGGGGLDMKPKQRILNLAGQQFGRLKALRIVGRYCGSCVWDCRCDCGETANVPASSLRRGSTRSCGCLRRETGAARKKWNTGKTYAIGAKHSGERIYRRRHSWVKAALRDLGNNCELCGWDKATCDVHHRVAKSQSGLLVLSNAQVLCPNCHRVIHDAKRGG